MPKISIIVPIYNTEKYIARCVESLINQTLKGIEILLIDDGSTDLSWEKIQVYEKYENIKLFKKENGGLSDARNYGIEKAKGEYLAFVDSDDYIELNMMESMYNLARKNGADIVICNLQKVNENGKVIKKITQISHLQEKIILKEDFSLFGEVSSFACNKLYKKELFKNIEFPKGLHFEDIATIPKLILKSAVIAKTDAYLYHYFERTGSITRNFTFKGLDMFRAIESVRKEFDKSFYKNDSNQWKRFVIYQGFYSFLAYLARVKERKLRIKMYKELQKFLLLENISKKNILNYKRLNSNYLLSLSFKKIIFYLIILFIPRLIIK